MRNDTPQNWIKNNPILGRGEIGCAIDEANGIITLKVGDGVHHWRDLEMRPGTKDSHLYTESSFKKYLDYDGLKHYNEYIQGQISSLQESMQKIQKAVAASRISISEAVNALNKAYKACQRSVDSINTINTLAPSIQKPIEKMAQAMQEEKKERNVGDEF